MAASQMIRVLCAKMNISTAELARRNETSPQNFNKKMQRESFNTDELREIARSVGCEYKSSFVLPDGDVVEEKFFEPVLLPGSNGQEVGFRPTMKNARRLTDADIERRCRYRLSRHGLRMKKVKGEQGPVYYLYEDGGDDTQPDDNDSYRWFDLHSLLDYCEELQEKEAEEH